MKLNIVPFKTQLIILTITLLGLSSLQPVPVEAQSSINKQFGDPVSVGAPIQQIAILKALMVKRMVVTPCIPR